MGRSSRSVTRTVGIALSVTMFLSSCGQSRAATQSVGSTQTTVSAGTGSVESSGSTTTSTELSLTVKNYGDGVPPTYPEATGVPTDPQIDATTRQWSRR